ncbi:MAG: DUF971 domain-containing protein [Verrucomicrobia bacterium]|nr:DUF971 domain-containing protein [Verrucomicrobiota bacterium]
MSSTTRLQPTDIQVFGHELAIRWSDGVESYLALEPLRRACPCATCSGEPDALGRIYKGDVSYDPARSFTMTSYSMVGGYAFQPVWGDGHQTGLYTFPLLRRLGGEGEPAASASGKEGAES